MSVRGTKSATGDVSWKSIDVRQKWCQNKKERGEERKCGRKIIIKWN